MKKLHEYIEHANECRDMARMASPAHRVQLEQMAATWEQLAEGRRRQLAKQTAGRSVPIEGETPAMEKPAS
jgi:hypothetical protein